MLCWWAVPVWAASSKGPLDDQSSATELRVVDRGEQGLDLTLDFGAMKHRAVVTPQGSFTELRLPGCGGRPSAGAPMLPRWRRLLRVPLGCRPEIQVMGDRHATLTMAGEGMDHPILPAQPPVSKSLDRPSTPLVLDEEAYARSTLAEQAVVRLVELGQLRGTRLVALEVDPLQWDPASDQLRLHHHLQLRVTFPEADWSATRALEARTRSPWYAAARRDRLLNPCADSDRDGITEYPVTMAVVAAPDFTEALQPFIQWKERKGFRVITGYLGDPEVGTSRTAIKAWLQGLYDAATPELPAPSFLLLVGDTNLLPTWSDLGGHSTDLRYVTLAGGDNLPDMLCGRLSARTLEQLQAILDKTLEYEQYTLPDPSYLDRSLLVAGVDEEYSPVHVNGQIHYAANHYFNEAHGIDASVYFYPQSAEPWVSDAVVADAALGRAFINYSGHGSSAAWLDPVFDLGQLNGLPPNHRYATVVGNCCQSNAFNLSTCFGEAWLRASERGAVGYLGASNDSYWEEDYWWGVGAGPIVADGASYEETGLGVYDGLFHDHGEDFADWFTSQGAMLLRGGLAVTEAGSVLTDYYWEIYNLMGDPSLTPWLRVPGANPVAAPDTVRVGQSALVMGAEPYSYVGLSQDGSWRSGGLVDAAGNLVLTFPPFTAPGAAELVITHPGKQPVSHPLVVQWPELDAPVVHISRPANGRASLTWEPVPCATGYRIWSSTGWEGDWTLEAATTDTEHEVNCFTGGNRRRFRVTAVCE